jgi:hypothetical protein
MQGAAAIAQPLQQPPPMIPALLRALSSGSKRRGGHAPSGPLDSDAAAPQLPYGLSHVSNADLQYILAR